MKDHDRQLADWAQRQRETDSRNTEFVSGVMEHLETIDQLLEDCSTNWKVARMARVDRNILRLAAFELRYRDDIPSRVTINEAVEIAKQYGEKDSGSFINGILDRIASLGPA